MTTVHYQRCRTQCPHAAAANAVTVHPVDGNFAVNDGGDVYIWRKEVNAERHADLLRMRICPMHSNHRCDCADVVARGSMTMDEVLV